LLLQGGQTNLRRIDRLDLILEDDLLNRMTEFLRCQPTRVCFCPVSFAGKVPAIEGETTTAVAA
jgi:hypothetical protein